MLKVIGAGVPRTGTLSLKVALERLGFGPCYHMYEVWKHPDHVVDRWLPVTLDMPIDWDRVFDGYQSSQDWPASGFWRELAHAYPDAKVVLTVRDPHLWYTSFRRAARSGPWRGIPQDELPQAVRPVIVAVRHLQPVMAGIGRLTFGEAWSFGEGLPDEDRAVAAFHRHVAAVQESLPADRLLVLDVRQGWGPLCDFLGVEPPADEPFPHLNAAEVAQRSLDKMAQGYLAELDRLIDSAR